MRKINLLLTFILFIWLLLSFPSHGEAAIPKPSNEFFVNDFAQVIDTTDEQAIQLAAVQLQEATTAQVVVVTVDSLQGEPLEDYAYQLFKQWGIGTAQHNNGVLILVSVGDRQSRIEVGYGLEGVLPDGKTGRIQDVYMIPYFKENDYSSGIRNGFLAVVQEVYVEYGIDPGDLEMPGRAVTTESTNANMVLFIIIIIILLIDWIFLRGRITRFFLMASMYSRRGGGHFRGGGGSHRGGGGGFSGGGGRSGGGGSSRGW